MRNIFSLFIPGSVIMIFLLFQSCKEPAADPNPKMKQKESVPSQKITNKKNPSTVVIDTSKYSARKIQEEALEIISQLDNITEDQNKKIQEILNNLGVFKLRSEREYIKYQRILRRQIRDKVLTKEQIEQFKSMRKN